MVFYSSNFMLFVPCVIHIYNSKQTKRTMFFLRYLYYIITLNIPTCFTPQGITSKKKYPMVLRKTMRNYV